jgi:ribonuclease D
MPESSWIADAAGVAAVGAACAAAPWIALDTEANSMHAYRERCCLVQINAGGRLFVIDPIALAGDDPLAPLRAPLEDPAITVWLHGGEYDAAVMRRDFRIQLRGVFDSQQAASLLGWEKTGYGSVVERLLGVQLAKEFSQYDWAIRPLDPGALAYAVDDVVHLPEAARQLRELISQADLAEECAIANRAVEDATWGGGYDPGGFWRVKGVRELGRPCLPVLAALWAWRDGVAREIDRPAGRVVNNETMLALCRRPIATFQQLKHAGVKSAVLASHGESLLACLKEANAHPPELPPRPHHREVPPEEEEREKRMKDWRRTESERRGVTMQAVLPAKALEHLKRYGAEDLAAVPQLGDKRVRLYGEKLRQLCAAASPPPQQP